MNKESIWTPYFSQLFIINVLLNLGQFMMHALLPKYVEHLGASAAIVGMVSSLFAITALGVRPFAGPSTRLFRNNRLLASAVSIIMLAFVCYGASGSISMIMAGRLLHGIGMGFLAPVSLALASDALPSRKLASGLGVFSLAQAIATAIGPALGLEMVRTFGYHATFLAGACLMGIVLLLSMRLKSEPVQRSRIRITVQDIIAFEVLIPAVMMFFLAGANACVQTFILIYGAAGGVGEIGLFFTAYAVCLLFTRPISGKMADRYGLDTVLIPGMLMFALSFIVISYARSLTSFIIAGSISAFGYGVCLPAIQTLCMRLVSPSRRGVAGNTNYIGVDTGYLFMPTIAGLIVTFAQAPDKSEIIGYAVMYRMMTIPILIALLLFLIYRTKLMTRQNMTE